VLLVARLPLARLAVIAYVCFVLLLGIFKGIAATAEKSPERTAHAG